MDDAEHGAKLVKFKDFRPTVFDQKGMGSEDQEDWRILPCTITRDTGALSKSNFKTAREILDHAGATYEAIRFGHWGSGWFEIIVVEPTEIGLRVAGEIACSLENYPVLDDEDYSDCEYEAVRDNWDAWQEWDFLNHLERMLSERAFQLIKDNREMLFAFVSDYGYNYSGGNDPHLDVKAEDLDRDTVAKMLCEIRTQNVVWRITKQRGPDGYPTARAYLPADVKERDLPEWMEAHGAKDRRDLVMDRIGKLRN